MGYREGMLRPRVSLLDAPKGRMPRLRPSVHGQIPIHLFTAEDNLSETYLAVPEAVGRIRRSVADYARAAGLGEPTLEAVRLAVSEAVTNVILHAYRGKPGQVCVTARSVENELWVLITDEGLGPNIPTEKPGLGWGLAIITDACDQFTLVERAGGGTEARMLFLIPTDQPDITLAGQ
jgi:anti-sigma regulatory factor (Ser/Thr protein kinase)